jgi:hypothetical protein
LVAIALIHAASEQRQEPDRVKADDDGDHHHERPSLTGVQRGPERSRAGASPGCHGRRFHPFGTQPEHALIAINSDYGFALADMAEGRAYAIKRLSESDT